MYGVLADGVPAQMGVQRLLLGAEGVEQVQGRLPFHPYVVPLQQQLQRNGDLPGLHGRYDPDRPARGQPTPRRPR